MLDPTLDIVQSDDPPADHAHDGGPVEINDDLSISDEPGNWEWCLVFHSAPSKPALNQDAVRKNVVDAFEHFQLQVSQVVGVGEQHDSSNAQDRSEDQRGGARQRKIFVRVRARDDDLLLTEAERSGFMRELAPGDACCKARTEAFEHYLTSGVLPLSLHEDAEQMYGFMPFSTRNQTRFVVGQHSSLPYFSSSERQRLVKSIMDRALEAWTDRMRQANLYAKMTRLDSARTTSTVGAADSGTWSWPQRLLEHEDDRIMLDDFIGAKSGQIKSVFPLHDMRELEALRLWGSWRNLNCARGSGLRDVVVGLLGVPTPCVRDYFGDPLALYFSWVQLYTKMLVWPAVFGFLCTWLQFSSSGWPSSPKDTGLTEPFAIFLALWPQILLARWRTITSIFKFRWGTEHFRKQEETSRNDFDGRPKQMHAPATSHDGGEVLLGVVPQYYSYWKRLPAVAASIAVLSVLIVLVLFSCHVALWMKARKNSVCDYASGEWSSYWQTETAASAGDEELALALSNQRLQNHGRLWPPARAIADDSNMFHVAMEQSTGPFRPSVDFAVAVQAPASFRAGVGRHGHSRVSETSALLVLHENHIETGLREHECTASKLGRVLTDFGHVLQLSNFCSVLQNRNNSSLFTAKGRDNCVQVFSGLTGMNLYVSSAIHSRSQMVVTLPGHSLAVYLLEKNSTELSAPIACAPVMRVADGPAPQAQYLLMGWCTAHWKFQLGGTFLALVSLTTLSLVYNKLAGRLNDFENWRTESEYQDALIIKSIVFETLNNFYLLLFILFLKVPHSTDLFGLLSAEPNQCMAMKMKNVVDCNVRNEDGDCLVPDCMFELQLQLVVVFTFTTFGKQIWEFASPYLFWVLQQLSELRKRQQFSKFKIHRLIHHILIQNSSTDSGVQSEAGDNAAMPPTDSTEDNDGQIREKRKLSAIEREASKPTHMGTRQEYEKLVIQFGYVTMFGTGFPLAPLFALVANIVEMRGDAYKLTHLFRRPEFFRQEDLGAWLSVLKAFAVGAIFTNSMVVGLVVTSVAEKIPSLQDTAGLSYPERVHDGRLWLIVVLLEHLLLLCGKFTQWLTPSELPFLAATRCRNQLYVRFLNDGNGHKSAVDNLHGAMTSIDSADSSVQNEVGAAVCEHVVPPFVDKPAAEIVGDAQVGEGDIFNPLAEQRNLSSEDALDTPSSVRRSTPLVHEAVTEEDV